MDLVRRSEAWKAGHRDSKIILAFRILLGLLLLVIGVYFVQNTEEIEARLTRSLFEFGDIAMIHYIGLAHIAGGIFIAAGFLTRVAVLFQIPILLGAILFVNAPRGVFAVYSEFILSFVILLMSLFFLFYGSGIFSLDKLLRRKKFYE